MSAAKPSSPSVSARMSRQARRDTTPEVAVRKLLHAAGRRYRINERVPGMSRRTIDIAFTRAKVAVMIDGCFWHGCPEHATQPKANAQWWRDKLDRNIARDRETTEHLASQGWTVLRFWEHTAAGEVAEAVQVAVDQVKTREAAARSSKIKGAAEGPAIRPRGNS